MNKGAIIFSILVATIISIILAFSIFGILYFHWGDIEAVKNSLSTEELAKLLSQPTQL